MLQKVKYYLLVVALALAMVPYAGAFEAADGARMGADTTESAVLEESSSTAEGTGTADQATTFDENPTEGIDQEISPDSDSVEEDVVTDPDESPVEDPSMPALNTSEHIVYISGQGAASFAPSRSLSRAETATMLCALLEEEAAEAAATFSDVTQDSWYYQTVSQLSGLGVLKGYADGTFRPNASITRAEFVSILAKFFPQEEGVLAFSDVPDTHWARESILTASAKGWVTGYADGTFRPEATITRAEAVTVLNRALGRSAASQTTQELLQNGNVAPFIDVQPDDWFYAAVMEAAVTHTFATGDGQENWTGYTYKSSGYQTGLQQIGSALYQVDDNEQIVFQIPGFQTIGGGYYYVSTNGGIPFSGEGITFIDGNLYYQKSDGSLLTDGSQGYLTFDSQGKYTTGNAQLDAQVKTALAACTTDGMTRSEKLRASYLYLRENCRYLSRAHHGRGTTDWTEESASFMFANHRGNCYCYAASFMYMARQLGYQAYCVSGGLGTKNSDHAWVMIDGHIFDPELEYAYLYRLSTHRLYNLYDISPSNAPFYYRFP